MSQSEYRDQIYDVFAEQDLDVSEQIEAALDIGTAYFGLSIGFYTRIEDGTQNIAQAVGDHPLIQPGEACPLEDAYCRRTIELDSALAIQNAATSTAIAESAVKTFDLGAYIGAKIIVNGETHGTVCFADTDPRADGFTDSDSQFVEVVARLIGQAVERRAYERELAKRENKLDEREERYRAVLDASFDVVFELDLDGTFTSFSDSVAELLGYTPAELRGRKFTAVLPSDEGAKMAEDVFADVLNGQTVEEEYLPLEHKSGEILFADVRKAPVYDCTIPEAERTPADIVGVQGMAHNVTDRYRRERLIEVLNRVLRHNVRNEVNVINGYAEILQERLTGDNVSLAAKITEASHRLTSLSETARKLQQNLDRKPELTAIDIVPIVHEAATQIRDRYTQATVTIEAPDTAVTQTAPRIETAVWELLDNAAKHAGDEPAVTLTLTQSDETVVITVSDNGPGLPEDEQEVLVAGKETPLVHGSGLGLWLVHWIVESVDGSLYAENTENGACIEMRL